MCSLQTVCLSVRLRGVCRVMYNDGDMLVAEYTAPGYVEKGEEFTVESIIAERRKGNSFEYLVKWKVRSWALHGQSISAGPTIVKCTHIAPAASLGSRPVLFDTLPCCPFMYLQLNC